MVNNNFKNDKFVTVIQEFDIIYDKKEYEIGSIDLTDVYFFVKNRNENYKILATGEYQVIDGKLIIENSVLESNTDIQVCRVINITASKYISDIVNVNTLREHYNNLVDNFVKIMEFLRTSGIKSDSNAMNYVFPLLEEGQVFMKKGLGFEGKQVLDINAELADQIDIAVKFFEKYIATEKKPEIDRYTEDKKKELELYTIAKKKELEDYNTAKKKELEDYTKNKIAEIIKQSQIEQEIIRSLGIGGLEIKIEENKTLITNLSNSLNTNVTNINNSIKELENNVNTTINTSITNLQNSVNSNKNNISTLQGTVNSHANSINSLSSNKYDKSGGTISGSITVTGGATFHQSIYASGNITAYSDRRLKKKISKLKDPLSKIKMINGYSYKMNGERYTGVIAQELEKVLPNAIVENNGYKTVAYNQIIPLLVECIKENTKDIEKLRGGMNG